MKAFLIRVGSDEEYGDWHGPVDPDSGEFVYVPIWETDQNFDPKLCRKFAEVMPALEQFWESHPIAIRRTKPECLQTPMHLDPDFDHLTYGDDGTKRGRCLLTLEEGDLIAFYASLLPISNYRERYVYALIGMYVVEGKAISVKDIPKGRWEENAHTRKLPPHEPTDVVVQGKHGKSGRLERCIPIGEWRDGAYRVRNDVLAAWGGLSVKNGWLQRSASPPSFNDPERFWKWLKKQRVVFLERNN